MVLVFRQAGRLIVAVAVCLLLLSSLTSLILPTIIEKADITVGDMRLEEPQVLLVSANESAQTSITLSSVLAKLESENTTVQLDEQFWQLIQTDIGRVFTYKKTSNAYVQQNFVGSEASDWMLVFTSTNSSGEKYKLKVNLNLQ